MKRSILAVLILAVGSATGAFALTSGQVEILRSGKPKDVQAAIDSGKLDISSVTSFELDPGNAIEAPAIFLAAFGNPDPGVIDVLARAGADVNAKGPGGRSPLMLACMKNSVAVVQKLISLGARVRAARDDGRTVLMYAAYNHPDPRVIAVLAAAGADVAEADENGKNALMLAADNNGNAAVVSALLQAGAQVNARDEDGWTPLLFAAAYNKNAAVTRTLLAAGADLAARNNDGISALMAAAGFSQNPDVMTVLAGAGADVSAAGPEGLTALMYAAANNPSPAMVLALLKLGAAVSTRAPEGATAVMFAAQHNPNPDVVAALLGAGAEANDWDRNGKTVLMYAAADAQNPEVISALLKAGADGQLKDMLGKTAVDYAQQNERLAGTEALRQLQENPDLSLEISSLSFDDIYPVFHSWYDTHALGRVVLSNRSTRRMTGIRVSFQMKEFMSDPKTCPAPSELAPGESRTVDLFGLFLPTILGTTEKTKTQARVDVDYTLGSQARHKSLVDSVSLLDRNATSWADTRRAAAFVTARDPSVLTFSKNISSMVKGRIQGAINPNLLTAMACFEALQLFGLTYSKDPVPVLTDNSQVADYIQFPGQTLQYKGGKCSDLSVLFCAILESVGIETAFITTPGHIFVAFSLDVSPADAAKAFSRPEDLVFRDGKSWIPVEVTESAGFLLAWKDGARQWRERSGSGQAGFTPLREAWQAYEPVALPGSAAALELPPAEKVVSAYQVEAMKFIDQEITPRIAALQEQIKTAGDPRKPTNELGVLYARFGRYDEARAQFQRLLAAADYVPALLNMGNIHYLTGQKDKALEYYQRAYAVDPANPRVLLAAARANYDLENPALAKKFYDELAARDPNMARQYVYLTRKEEQPTRAADRGAAEGGVEWAEE